MAKDSDEAADRPWNGAKAGWIEAEKLFDRKMYDQLGDPGQWYWRLPINRPPTGGDLAFSWKKGQRVGVRLARPPRCTVRGTW